MTSTDPDRAIARIDRSRGALLGLAVGDALGTTLEFSPPGSFTPVKDMVGVAEARINARRRRTGSSGSAGRWRDPRVVMRSPSTFRAGRPRVESPHR